jgi:hypothetical protein
MCDQDYHDCPAAGCVSNFAVETCGSGCSPCYTPPNGMAVCNNGFNCTHTCNSGYYYCPSTYCAAGFWGFNQGSVEGWSDLSFGQPGIPAPTVDPSVKVGASGGSLRFSRPTPSLVAIRPSGRICNELVNVQGKPFHGYIRIDNPLPPSSLISLFFVTSDGQGPAFQIPHPPPGAWAELNFSSNDPRLATAGYLEMQIFILGAEWSGNVWLDEFSWY